MKNWQEAWKIVKMLINESANNHHIEWHFLAAILYVNFVQKVSSSRLEEYAVCQKGTCISEQSNWGETYEDDERPAFLLL